MRLSEITDSTADAVRTAGSYLSDLATPTVRLGVTGLSRAGKTIFITALVRLLTESNARPPLYTDTLASFRAYLEPQPDDDLPRFAYEQHLSKMSAEVPEWPESTRQISQLRLTLEWDPDDWMRRTAGIGRRLHLDIVDYPGEWLLDLGLLEQDFATWSRTVSERMLGHSRDGRLEAWQAFASTHRADDKADEQIAIKGGEIYTGYLASVRANDPHARLLSPGRFLMPGDLAGSPLLSFFPLVAAPGDTNQPGTLGELLERRFESYKSLVVRPFFERHFRSLDRQIVLVDVLGAINGGAKAMTELERTLESTLVAFRPGKRGWLLNLLGRRIDRVLFAATKADHIHGGNRGRLQAILSSAIARAERSIRSTGADTDVAAIASLRATQDVEYRDTSGTYACIRGKPIAGETIGGKRFDGDGSAAVFPGDLPDDPLDSFDGDVLAPGSLNFVRFLPPGIAETGHDIHVATWPHIGMRKVLDYLIGDRLR